MLGRGAIADPEERRAAFARLYPDFASGDYASVINERRHAHLAALRRA